MENFTPQNKAISIIGKRNSGKSQKIKYLSDYSIFQNEFDEVYVICPTNHFYDSLDSSNNIMDSYDEEWV